MLYFFTGFASYLQNLSFIVIALSLNLEVQIKVWLNQKTKNYADIIIQKLKTLSYF